MSAVETTARGRGLPLYDLMLYALVVFAWGTSWIALKMQVGTVAPEVSVLWRFLIAAPLMAGLALWRGESLRFAPSLHLRFAAIGTVLFSSNFILFYHGGVLLPSGLLSVIFSLASITNLLFAWGVFNQRPTWRLALGGLFGVLGVASMLEPQFELAGGASTLAGVALCVLGTLFFSSGNMISTGLQRAKIPVFASSAWGMAYGAAVAFALALAFGRDFTFDASPAYALSLVWLAMVATVLAFATYLTLLGRIGAARAGYATVLFPAVAVIISVVVEGYPLNLFVIAGFALVALGNILVLRR